MEYVKNQEWPPDHAQRAYDKGYFVEAIQVLHAWLECKCRELVMLVGAVHFDARVSETGDIVNEVSFKDTVKTLFGLGQISKQEYEELQNLNSLRNKIIHGIYKDSWEKEYRGVPKHEYDRLFGKAMEYAVLIGEKIEEIIGNRDGKGA